MKNKVIRLTEQDIETLVKKIIKEDMKKKKLPLKKKLSPEEEETLNNILNVAKNLQESSKLNNFYNFLKKQKLTLALLTALMASPGISQAQQDVVEKVKMEMEASTPTNNDKVTVKYEKAKEGNDDRLTISTSNTENLDVIQDFLYKHHKLESVSGSKGKISYNIDKSNIQNVLKSLKNLIPSENLIKKNVSF
jgi:hypothetical protein